MDKGRGLQKAASVVEMAPQRVCQKEKGKDFEWAGERDSSLAVEWVHLKVY